MLNWYSSKIITNGDLLFIALISILLISHIFFKDNSSSNDLFCSITQQGNIAYQFRLPHSQIVSIDGPIGETIIEIQHKKVRIIKDPGPKQYCVEKGWIDKSGELLICLPNQIIINISSGQNTYDSFSF